MRVFFSLLRNVPIPMIHVNRVLFININYCYLSIYFFLYFLDIKRVSYGEKLNLENIDQNLLSKIKLLIHHPFAWWNGHFKTYLLKYNNQLEKKIRNFENQIFNENEDLKPVVGLVNNSFIYIYFYYKLLIKINSL